MVDSKIIVEAVLSISNDIRVLFYFILMTQIMLKDDNY